MSILERVACLILWVRNPNNVLVNGFTELKAQ